MLNGHTGSGLGVGRRALGEHENENENENAFEVDGWTARWSVEAYQKAYE
jgi:hypothetical protein